MIRLFLFLVLLPTISLADPIAIRSGEHDSFSRLVLAIGAGVDWSVSEVEDGFVIQATGAVDGFDVSQIFDRIPRTRIASATQTAADVLHLEAACDCYVDAFLWRPGHLVVDIADGPNPMEPSVAVDPLGPELPAVSDNAAQGRLPDLLSLREGASHGVEIPHALLAEPKSPEVTDAEAALLESIARAASQGLLDAAVDPHPRADEESVDPAPENATVLAEAVEDLSQRQPGVGVSTAVDRDLALIGDILEAQSKPHCLSASLFEIEQWADERPIHVQMADLAEALSGEFGAQPREAQEDLARIYLHFGFGAEARLVLNADRTMSQSRQIMMELAGLIDDYGDAYPMISAQSGCETPAALWAFLAQPQPSSDRNHIIRSFFELPQPLRGQLAPRLSQSFLTVGDDIGAGLVLRASEDGDSEGTHEVRAAHAMISEASGDPQSAIALLEEEVHENVRSTPESLIRLIDLALEQGQTPNEADLILADAMLREHREAPIAGELTRAMAYGRTALGHYQTALDLAPASNDVAAVTDHIYVQMTKHAEAGAFLEHAFDPNPPALASETENAMARRLIDLGFPERASFFLTAPARRDAAAERRYLRAEAAVASSDYNGAIDALVGLSDPRARQLRSQAYAGLGQHREALSAIGPEPSELDEDLQFRAEAWTRLADQEDQALAAFADIVVRPQIAEEIVSLSDRRALLDRAEESRQAVEGLLSRFESSDVKE